MFGKSDKILNKRMTGNEKKGKRIWYESPESLTFNADFMKPRRGPSTATLRRSRQLGVVLYEYISSLVNSGEIDSRLPELNVEIVKVKIPPAFNVINVYWLASGTSRDEEIQSVLAEAAYSLRTSLTSLHLMGNLPPVQFVKDLSASRLQEVETLLAQADMGPDYEPTSLGANLKSPLQLKYTTPPISETLQVKLDKMNKTINQKRSKLPSGETGATEILPSSAMDSDKKSRKSENVSFSDENLNEIQFESNENQNVLEAFDNLRLRSDIYDVNHDELLQQILHSKHKMKDRFYDVGDEKTQDASVNNVKYITKEMVRKQIELRQRKLKKIDKNKMLASEAMFESHYGHAELGYDDKADEEADVDFEDDFVEYDFIDEEVQNEDADISDSNNTRQ